MRPVGAVVIPSGSPPRLTNRDMAATVGSSQELAGGTAGRGVIFLERTLLAAAKL